MAFDWSSTGQAPATDEFEVSVVGPGFGECIIIHVGGGRWIIVDSCIDSSLPGVGIPVAERYLRHLGVPMETSVDLIVATHWHDDHVRGIARLFQSCTSARFSCASALLGAEFATFVLSLSTGSGATDGAKVREFAQVLRILAERQVPVRYATGSKTLFSWPAGQAVGSTQATVKSLSPSDKEYSLFLEMVASATPQPFEAKRSASKQTPNLGSVVLHIDAGPFAVLLGADMEIHHDPARGWNSVLQEAQVSQVQKSLLFKVAHHGSANGNLDAIWTELLHPAPLCVVTPFNRLPDTRKLPTEADIDRLLTHGRVFLTAPRTGRRLPARDPAVIRSLRESQIVTRDLSSEVGMVRFRKRANQADWRQELFPAARELNSAA